MSKPSRPDVSYGLMARNQETIAHVIAVIRACNGNVTEAAVTLGLPLRTLRRWVAKLPELKAARAIGWAGQ